MEPFQSKPLVDGISVIVPTKGRIALTQSLLCSLQLARREFDRPTEVIVVDDSTADQAKEIRRLCDQFDAEFLPGPKSVGAKRNLGIRHTRFAISLFVDSDCGVDPQLLVEHFRVYQKQGAESIAGCVGPTRFVGPDNWLWRAVSHSSYVMPFSFPDMMAEVPWGPSSNVSFRTGILLQIGGFDETFPERPGGEDVDLGLRVVKQGLHIVTNRAAVVSHSKDTWNTLALMRARVFQWGRADYYLHTRHPDRLTLSQPRLLPVLFLMVVSALLQSILRSNGLYMALPFVWMLVAVSLFAFLTCRFMGWAAPTWRHQILVVLLNQFFEAGLIWEGIKRRTLRPCFTLMLYTEGQQLGEWISSVYWTTSMLVAFLAVAVFALIIRAF